MRARAAWEARISAYRAAQWNLGDSLQKIDDIIRRMSDEQVHASTGAGTIPTDSTD